MNNVILILCIFQVGYKNLFTGAFETYRLDLGKLNLGRIH